MNRLKTIKTITINKRVSVDIEEEVGITSADIMEAIDDRPDQTATNERHPFKIHDFTTRNI